jgi:hypothetical protein
VYPENGASRGPPPFPLQPFKRFQHRRSNISDSLESAPAVNRVIASKLLQHNGIRLLWRYDGAAGNRGDFVIRVVLDLR